MKLLQLKTIIAAFVPNLCSTIHTFLKAGNGVKSYFALFTLIMSLCILFAIDGTLLAVSASSLPLGIFTC